MAITTQELFNNLQALGKKPAPAPVAMVETIEREEMGNGWYAQHVINGVALRTLGAYNRDSSKISIFNGGQWGEMDGKFAEIDAEMIITEFHDKFHI